MPSPPPNPENLEPLGNPFSVSDTVSPPAFSPPASSEIIDSRRESSSAAFAAPKKSDGGPMDAILCAIPERAGLPTAEEGPLPAPPMGATAGPRPRSACD